MTETKNNANVYFSKDKWPSGLPLFESMCCDTFELERNSDHAKQKLKGVKVTPKKVHAKVFA